VPTDARADVLRVEDRPQFRVEPRFKPCDLLRDEKPVFDECESPSVRDRVTLVILDDDRRECSRGSVREVGDGDILIGK
jgi:hypothetical protein